MIKEDEVFYIGKITKPHGLQGEVSLSFTSDVFDGKEEDLPFLVCEIDGILVPFFIENLRYKGSDIALVKFEGIDNEADAKTLSGVSVFMHRKHVDNDDIAIGVDYYIDYKVYDENEVFIGTITGVDDSTENVLFLVENEEGDEYMIPATDEFIIGIDDNDKIIKMEIPDGLLSI